MTRPKELVYADVCKNIVRRSIDLSFGRVDSKSQGIEVATGVIWEYCEDAATREPTISLPYEVATKLMDELWRAGVRPSDDISSAGEKTALQNHIKALEARVAFVESIVKHQLGMVS